MVEGRKDMSMRDNLGQSWTFLVSALEAKDFTPSASVKMKKSIEDIIYKQDAEVSTVSVLGILEMIKHDLINDSQGGDDE
jgi:hypothetical protein